MRIRWLPITVPALLAGALLAGALVAPPPASASTSVSGSFAMYNVAPGESRNECTLLGTGSPGQLEGAAVVSAEAWDMNAVIQVQDAGIMNSSVYGWDYCVTIRNLSAVTTNVDVFVTGAIPSGYAVKLAEPALAAGATGRYCWVFGSHVNTGPVAVMAEPTAVNALFKTLSVSLEDDPGYGWKYCASIKNASGTASTFSLAADGQMTAAYPFNTPIGSIPAGGSSQLCFYSAADARPVAVIAVANTTNVPLATTAITRENRTGYGWVYCATIANQSGTATTATVDTQSKF